MEFLKKVGSLNLLLILIPVALFLHWTNGSEVAIFFVSGFAIIPLAGLMGKSTEILSEKLGPGIGGLLNASFGNAAELILAIVALKAGMVEMVRASITGSILGNILLVLGAAFFVGGLQHEKQKFNATAAGMAATMLALGAIGLLIPALFHAYLKIYHLEGAEKDLSFEISVVLFTTYLLMLLFSLKTHKHLYGGPSQEEDSEADSHLGDSYSRKSVLATGNFWNVKSAIAVLIVSTIAIAWMSEILVGAVEVASHEMGWTEIFVGVVVIAIVGNAAEHSTALLAAWKDNVDLGFHIAVGSGMQIALFVAPLLVFLSYFGVFPEQLSLVFNLFEVSAIVISVMIVGLVAYDGESNWLEGLLLLAVYLILAIAFYHLPVAAH